MNDLLSIPKNMKLAKKSSDLQKCTDIIFSKGVNVCVDEYLGNMVTSNMNLKRDVERSSHELNFIKNVLIDSLIKLKHERKKLLDEKKCYCVSIDGSTELINDLR